MEWILAFCGITIDFIGRYDKRKNKTKNPSFTYWIKDNWAETVQSLLFVIVVLLILNNPETVVDSPAVTKWFNTLFAVLPDGVIFPGKLLLSFIFGLTVNALVYKYNKRKEKWILSKQN